VEAKAVWTGGGCCCCAVGGTALPLAVPGYGGGGGTNGNLVPGAGEVAAATDVLAVFVAVCGPFTTTEALDGIAELGPGTTVVDGVA
jgi:hypothetical protein